MDFSENAVKNKQRKLGRKKGFRVVAGGIFAAVLVLFAVIYIFRAISYFSGYVGSLSGTDLKKLYEDGTPSVIYDSNGTEVEKLFASYSDSTYTQIERIPESVKNAFIAFYDPTFYSHSELNIEGMLEDIYIGLTGDEDESPENISEADDNTRTITQRLINNQLLYEGLGSGASERLKNNFIAQRWAMRLQQDVDKDEVLERYLNTLYFGYNTVGVYDAAERYFNKSITDIDVPEAAVLVALSLDFTRNDPVDGKENCREIVKLVLEDMLDEEMISEKDYEDYLGDDVLGEVKQDHKKMAEIRSDAADFYDQELVRNLMDDLKDREKFTQTQAYNAVFRGGLRIFSCRDRELSEAAVKAISDDSAYPKKIKYKLDYVYTCKDKEGDLIEFTQDDLMYHLAEKNHSKNSRRPYFSSEKKALKKIKEYEDYLEKHGFTRTDEGKERTVNLSKQPQASFILINQKNGYVEAMSGGRGESSFDRKSGVNRASRLLRQPGNLLSPFSVYLPAIDSYHMTLADVVDASPTGLDSLDRKYTVKLDYTGLTTMRSAMRYGNNAAAIKFFKKISPTASYDYMTSLGVSTLIDSSKTGLQSEDGFTHSEKGSKAAVGVMQNGISLLELTAAYNAVADDGKYTRPVFYTKAERKNGENIITSRKNGTRVMKRSSAWLLKNVMQEGMAESGGKNLYLHEQDMASAGVRGRSVDHTDSWFEGFTPYMTLGVWMGSDDETKKINCGIYASRLWSEIMNEAIRIKKEKPKQFELDKEITAADICSKSGKLGIKGLCDSENVNSRIYTEYFVKGTEPEESCDRHVRFLVNKYTGFPADSSTPAKDIEKRVYLIKGTDRQNDETADRECIASESFLDSLKGEENDQIP